MAEKLYQQGVLSYPRTETDQYDPKFDFMSLIAKQTSDPNWGAFASQCVFATYVIPLLESYDIPDFNKEDSMSHAKERRTIKHILPFILRDMREILLATRRKYMNLSRGDFWHLARKMLKGKKQL